MGNSERPRSPQAKGHTCGGSQNGRTMGQCPAALLGPGPATAGPQREKPWVPRYLARPSLLLQSGQRDQDDSWGLHWRPPAFMAPAGLWRRVSELSLRQAPGSASTHPGLALAASFAGQGATWTQACAVSPAFGSSVWCPCHWPRAR